MSKVRLGATFDSKGNIRSNDDVRIETWAHGLDSTHLRFYLILNDSKGPSAKKERVAMLREFSERYKVPFTAWMKGKTRKDELARCRREMDRQWELVKQGKW
jgi:hypothetical protein